MLEKPFACFVFLLSLSFVLILALNQGCTSHIHTISAVDKGFEEIIFQANAFHIKALVNSRGTDDAMTVYIEGDGQAWKNRHTPSRDPSPRNSIALQLAIRDPALKVAYLARPCQYVGKKDLKCKLSNVYWTSHRYAHDIIEAMNIALDGLKKKTTVDKLKLVGFSGGGTIAVLLSARRSDILGITTIASNLDHELWTAQHRVTPLHASLNAADYAEKVQFIPQIHFAGGKDSTVNEQVIQSYCDRMSDGKMARIVVMKEYTHLCCWVENWPDLLKEKRIEEL